MLHKCFHQLYTPGSPTSRRSPRICINVKNGFSGLRIWIIPEYKCILHPPVDFRNRIHIYRNCVPSEQTDSKCARFFFVNTVLKNFNADNVVTLHYPIYKETRRNFNMTMSTSLVLIFNTKLSFRRFGNVTSLFDLTRLPRKRAPKGLNPHSDSALP